MTSRGRKGHASDLSRYSKASQSEAQYLDSRANWMTIYLHGRAGNVADLLAGSLRSARCIKQ
eukprot:6190808-Pleurochrysis_carterae.AAC.1